MHDKYEIPNGIAIPVDKELALQQAQYIYKLAITELHNEDKYRSLMGVANMLFMLSNGFYTIQQHSWYGNAGVY